MKPAHILSFYETSSCRSPAPSSYRRSWRSPFGRGSPTPDSPQLAQRVPERTPGNLFRLREADHGGCGSSGGSRKGSTEGPQAGAGRTRGVMAALEERRTCGELAKLRPRPDPFRLSPEQAWVGSHPKAHLGDEESRWDSEAHRGSKMTHAQVGAVQDLSSLRAGSQTHEALA